MLSLALLAVPVVLLGDAAARDAAPPPSRTELETLSRQLESNRPEERLAAARKITELPPAGLSLYVERLRRPRTTTPAAFRQVILETWAQVPNPEYPAKGELWMKKPEPPWKPLPAKLRPKGQPRPRRPPPHDPEQVEWLTALNDLDLEGNPELRTLPDRVTVRAEALEAVALLRALAATGQAEATNAIFEFAFQLEGVFRDECGRALRSMGSVALPTLIRRMHLQGKGTGKQNRWALWQLDRMDRARPAKALATAPDDRVRAEMLHAYGEVRSIDAVDAVLAHVDSASRQVRRAARWAWMQYVAGPLPPAPPLRKRKLPGGKEESEAKQDYLSARELATLSLERELAALEPGSDGAPVPGLATIKERKPDEPIRPERALQLTQVLFAYYDTRHAAVWEEQLRAARAQQEAGDLEGAVRGYQQILLYDPFHERRGEMAEAFLTLGERRFAAGDHRAAAGYLQQGVALAPDPAKTRSAQAKLEFLDGLGKIAAGQADPGPFRRAIELDPQFTPAKKQLEALLGQQQHRRWQGSVLMGGAFIVAMIVAALLVSVRLAGRRSANPRGPTPEPGAA
jgi:tetratricopeptide (TPR) repeat protein